MKTYLVPNMNCKHCVMKVDNALKTVGITAQINLAQHTVSSDGDEVTIRTVLEKIGYPVQ